MICGQLSLPLTTAALIFVVVSSVSGQATYTAKGPGSYAAIGAIGSGFQADYGRQHLSGVGAFVDLNLYRRVGIEAEFRTLQYNSSQALRQSTLAIGPKISTHGRDFRPYAKLLAGRGHLGYPYGDARGSYFTVAPGAGLDWRLAGKPVTIRIVDFEYQFWPWFTFGTLRPYGFSSGVSVRVF